MLKTKVKVTEVSQENKEEKHRTPYQFIFLLFPTICSRFSRHCDPTRETVKGGEISGNFKDK